MLPSTLLLSFFLAATAKAQTSISTLTSASSIIPTGVYLSLTSQISGLTTAISYTTLTLTSNSSILATVAATNATNSSSTSTSTHTSSSLLLVGTVATTAGTNATATTTTAALATNTQACNEYVEFCDRKYSNITMVCSHNSAFIKANNAFANQQVSIPGQLNDGIRMIQGETHYVNNTIYSCHSSCDFLNAGTLESELTIVREWVEEHPYDVVTVLIVNSDYALVGNYTDPIVNSGLVDYAYYPPKVPMTLDDWPTLSEMILSRRRVVIFMDYMANQSQVPYILDEFTQMSETPFSPTDPDFPCAIQRPPMTPRPVIENRLYLANHNLNVGITISGDEILIPNFADLEELNQVTGNISLGLMAETCISNWTRPPNFLLVDFYNYGNGSVFEVAAQMNNVTYNRKCCGTDTSVSGAEALRSRRGLVVALVGVALSFFLLA